MVKLIMTLGHPQRCESESALVLEFDESRTAGPSSIQSSARPSEPHRIIANLKANAGKKIYTNLFMVQKIGNVRGQRLEIREMQGTR